MTRPGDRRFERRPEFKGGARVQALRYSSSPPMMFGQSAFNQPSCACLFFRRSCRALSPRFSRNGPDDRGVEPDGSLRDLQRDRARGHTTTGGHHRPGHLARDRCFFGGWLTDFLARRTGSPRWSRTAQSAIGAGLAASGLLASVFTDNTVLSSILVAIACLGVQLQLLAWWASATQVSGKHVGALFGLMNMIGNVGAAILQTLFGYFVEMMKRWGYTGRARWDPGI
jgi:hypothetical protein